MTPFDVSKGDGRQAVDVSGAGNGASVSAQSPRDQPVSLAGGLASLSAWGVFVRWGDDCAV